MRRNPDKLNKSQLGTDVLSMTRRDVIAAAGATVFMSAQAGSPASAAVQAEGYFLVFNKQSGIPGNADQYDRVFFIPSDWLEVFEVTDVYRSKYPELPSNPSGYENWKEGLRRIRMNNAGNNPKKMKVSALYASSTDSGAEEALPGKTAIEPTLPDLNHTYLAMSMSPAAIDQT